MPDLPKLRGEQVRVRTRADLRENQRLIESLTMQNDACLIVAKMGAGKTGATATTIRNSLDRFDVRHWLIIAPKFVAQNTWIDEFKQWAHTQCLSVAVAVGDEATRLAAVRARADVTLINFDNLRWLAMEGIGGTVANWYWDGVVIDESSRMKAGELRTKPTKTKRPDGTVRVSKGGNITRFGVLAVARKRAKKIILLTGTPTPQGLMDLWGQIYLLDQGVRLGFTKSEFEKRYFYKDRDNPHMIYPRAGAEKAIMDRIKDVMFTIPDQKVADDAIFSPVHVDLPPDTLRHYKEFQRTLYSQPYDVRAVSSGVLANKLLQFANGHMYQDDKTVVPIHEAKFEALQELHEQAHDESLLIAYGFQFDKDEMRRRIPGLVVANEYKGDLVGDWNKGKIKRLAAHPASIGHGTNLQYGGRLLTWFGLTFSLELWQQMNMRLPRSGQTGQVMIYPIIARGTYDEKAISVLQNKEMTQDRIVRNFLSDMSV